MPAAAASRGPDKHHLGVCREILVHQHRAAFSEIQAGGDVHQRGLSGAILAQQRMNLPALGGKVRVVEHREAVETLADAAQLDCG